MYSEIVLSKLETYLEHIEVIENYSVNIISPQDFLLENKELNYDGTLMRVQVLGDLIKRISKSDPIVISDLNYSQINDLIKFRDFVSHHYEKLEHEIVFDICKRDIPLLKVCLIKLIKEKFN